MVTVKKVNKSEAIRQALAKHPGKKPKWIVEMLLGKKIEVTPQMVSTIKSKSKVGSKETKAVNSPKNDRMFRGWPGAYGDLQDTLTYIKAVGGLEKAKQLIELVEMARQV